MKSWLRQEDGSWVETEGPAVTKTGKVLTEAEIEVLVEEAERGYDVEQIVERNRRP